MRWIWFSGLMSLALLVGMGVYLLPLSPSLVALQFTFDQSAFQVVLAAWQPDGVARFRSHLPVDYGLLVCYGVFGYLLASQTSVFARLSSPVRWLLTWAMPVAAVSDAVENALHYYLTSGAQQVPPLVYLVAGCSATLKSALIGIFLVSALLAWQRKRQKRRG